VLLQGWQQEGAPCQPFWEEQQPQRQQEHLSLTACCYQLLAHALLPLVLSPLKWSPQQQLMQ
jgi:hypothetical protein